MGTTAIGDQIRDDKQGAHDGRRPNSCRRWNHEKGSTMDDLTTLLTPTDCALLLIAGTTPAQRTGALSPAPAALAGYAWQQHCRGLFHTPTAA